MRFSCDRAELLAVCKKLEPLTKYNPKYPVTEGIRLHATSDGVLDVMATNISETVRFQIDAEVEVPTIRVIQAQPLLGALTGTEDTAVFSFDKSTSMIVKCGDRRSRPREIPTTEWPETPKSDDGLSWQPLDGAVFRDALDRVRWSAGSGAHLPERFKSITLNWTQDRLEIAGVTSVSMAVVPLDAEGVGGRLLAPEAAKRLVSLLGDAEVRMAIRDGVAYFRQEGWELATLCRNGTPPAYHKGIPDAQHTAVFHRGMFAAAVERAGLFAPRSSHRIDLFLSTDGVVRVHGRDPEHGEIDTELSGEVDADRTLSLNHRVLSQALDQIESDQVRIRYVDTTTNIRFEDPDHTERHFVIAPMHDTT